MTPGYNVPQYAIVGTSTTLEIIPPSWTYRPKNVEIAVNDNFDVNNQDEFSFASSILTAKYERENTTVTLNLTATPEKTFE